MDEIETYAIARARLLEAQREAVTAYHALQAACRKIEDAKIVHLGLPARILDLVA